MNWFVEEQGIYFNSEFLTIMNDIIFESIIHISSIQYKDRSGTWMDLFDRRNVIRFFGIVQSFKYVGD